MYICINKNIVRDFKNWIGKIACKLVGHSKLLMSSPFQLSVHHRFMNSKKKPTVVLVPRHTRVDLFLNSQSDNTPLFTVLFIRVIKRIKLRSE